MESDEGNFQPSGFGFSGLPEANAVVTQIGNVLLGPIGAGNVTDDGPHFPSFLTPLILFQDLIRITVPCAI